MREGRWAFFLFSLLHVHVHAHTHTHTPSSKVSQSDTRIFWTPELGSEVLQDRDDSFDVTLSLLLLGFLALLLGSGLYLEDEHP